MKEFLKKIHLIDHLTTEIEGIHKNEFADRLKNEVNPSDLGIFSDAFDAFSSSDAEYKGQVSYEGFKIKRKKRFFDMNMNMAIATGSFMQKEEKLVITTEINGFRKMFIFFYLFGIFFYLTGFIAFMFVEDATSSASLIAMPFLAIHAAFWFGIPYLVMRRSTRRMKRELEREFHYIARK